MARAMGPRDHDDAILQAGAVPFRRRTDGTVQVLLITNRTGGWIVPKGRIDSGHTPQQTAQNEAMEEAGVIGTVMLPVMGFYDYQKLGRTWRVGLFAMPVDRVLESWPEMAERQREWVTVDEAIRRVAFPELRDILERFEHFERHGAA